MNTSLRRAIKLIMPPAVLIAGRWIMNLPTRGRLFDGHDDLFHELISRASGFGEYGCGASTIWTAKNTSLPIVTVDTSKVWLDHVRSQVSQRDKMSIIGVDMGPLGDWGRPLDYSCRKRFMDYVEAPWTVDQPIDLILIDGRFRMACFLTSLLRAKPGTVILFDDYIERRHYHVAESFLPISQRNERQAAFVVPELLDRDHVEAERDRFLYVME